MLALRVGWEALRHPVMVLVARVLASICAVGGLLWVGIVGVFLVVFYLMYAVTAEDGAFYFGVALVVGVATLGFAVLVVLVIYGIWYTDEVGADVRRLAAFVRRHRAGH